MVGTVGVLQLGAEHEVRNRTAECTNGKEEHAARNPSGTMAATGEIGEEQGGADLADFGDTEQHAGSLGFDLEEFLDGREDADDVGEVHALAKSKKILSIWL